MIMMTRQEMLNKAYLGIIAQGGASVSMATPRATCFYRQTRSDGSVSTIGPGIETSTCFYRQTRSGGTVRKCAMGHLIPDDKYDYKMETKRASFVNYRFRLFGTQDNDFLDNLQKAHDVAAVKTASDETFLIEFKKNITKLATKYDLSIPEES